MTNKITSKQMIQELCSQKKLNKLQNGAQNNKTLNYRKNMSCRGYNWNNWELHEECIHPLD